MKNFEDFDIDLWLQEPPKKDQASEYSMPHYQQQASSSANPHSSPLENVTAAPWFSDEIANVQNFQPVSFHPWVQGPQEEHQYLMPHYQLQASSSANLGQQSHSSPLENFTAAPWLTDEMANVQNFQPDVDARDDIQIAAEILKMYNMDSVPLSSEMPTINIHGRSIFQRLASVPRSSPRNAFFMMLFGLRRLNFIPWQMRQYRQALEEFRGLNELPTIEATRDDEQWSPYKAVAAYMIWQAYENNRG
ncbi:hypothetical protein DCAR_0730232 [Daucus carota subsp. sativus]|uniref:Uncharacterized protein n=1 Tax=Daucus carota subsp. sativus TaxID=79200 RepID=A0A164URB3_DAUCS|nr:hypothetical protein DCAR_0730232 [Daucus carota subsp. sativus]